MSPCDKNGIYNQAGINVTSKLEVFCQKREYAKNIRGKVRDVIFNQENCGSHKKAACTYM